VNQLSESFINELPKTNEKTIDKYIWQISNEISKEANVIGIQKARQNANKKYGKFWRERLTSKKIHKGKSRIGHMSYY